MSGVLNALDFAIVTNKKDRQLLDEAKYGELKEGKMSEEQYA